MDVYIIKDKVKIIDFNSFYHFTEPLLFNWNDLLMGFIFYILILDEWEYEFRIILSENEAYFNRNNRNLSNGYPIDLNIQNLSNVDFDQFLNKT